MGYSFQLAARVLLYAPSHRQDSTYHNMKDQSDNPSHHKKTLHHGATPHSWTYTKNNNDSLLEISLKSDFATNKCSHHWAIGGTAPNQLIARSEFEVHRQIYTEWMWQRLWLVHICDSGDLCRYFDIYPMYSVAFVVWWIITVTFATCWYLECV